MSAVGRPTNYTEELAKAICVRLMDGQSLRSICLDADMPCRTTVYEWIQDHAEFADLYRTSREYQGDTYADESIDIADDGSNDYTERFNGKGESMGYVADQEHIQRSRLRVETRKWAAAVLRPRKYGPKSELSLTGANGGPVVTAAIPTTDPVAAAAFYQEMIRGGDEK